MADIIPNVPELAGPLPKPVFHDPKHHIKIYQGDCLEILAAIPADCVDLIFADPPYFLSNDGITCHAGKMVSVNKGTWDCTRGHAKIASYRLGVRWIAIPDNRHVRDKNPRQQLQVLRDLGFRGVPRRRAVPLYVGPVREPPCHAIAWGCT